VTFMVVLIRLAVPSKRDPHPGSLRRMARERMS
jgi:hypothetical protein